MTSTDLAPQQHHQLHQQQMWPPMMDGSVFSANEPSILVVDPATRKLCIPIRAVLHTQALTRLDRVPSICMLYLQGRCRQGSACHQLHADPTVVEMLRSEASLRTSCCPQHGEEVTQANLNQLAPELDTVSVDGHRVAAHRVATTNGMRRAVTDRNPDGPVLNVTRTQVCRLHVLGRCRYAEDCNFIHLCRALTDGEDPDLANMLANVVTSTPNKGHRGSNGFMRGTPSSAFVPPMPPSPLYAGVPASPNGHHVSDHFLSLDHNDNSQETTPPSTPALNGSITTPHTAWRHEPYSWQCVSPVRPQ